MRPRPRPSRARRRRVLEALLDDLNTPKAIAEMHALQQRAPAARRWPARCAFFGFRADELRRRGRRSMRRRRRCRRRRSSAGSPRATAARKAKNFAESDRIRDELAAHGRRAEGRQGRHHLGDRAMMARAHPQVRAAAVPAGGRAAARRDLPRQHRGTDRRRLQRGAAGGLGLGRRRRGSVRASGSASS